MKGNEKELMERYIYEVIRRVPSGQQEEIRMELQELIGDMYEAEGSDMEAVLAKLGDPSEFAKKYRDESSYVISPAYYDNYIWVLKIVLICVAASSILSWPVSVIVNGFSESITSFGVNRGLIGSLVFAFGMVTLIFAVLERLKVNVDIRKKKAWSVESLSEGEKHEKKMWTPSQMSQVPGKKGLISRGETVVGIIFIVIFGVLLIAAPQLFGAYIIEDSKLIGTIPIFNLSEWHRIVPVMSAAVFFSFLDEVIRLITGCYCKIVLVSNIVTSVIGAALAVVVLKFLPMWNLNFADEVSAQFGTKFTSTGDLMFYWGTDRISDIVLAVICVIIAAEVLHTIYKTVRYGV